MTEIDRIINSLKRIAEVEGMIKLILVNALKSSNITSGNQQYAGNATTMHELWTNSYGDKFFNMGTFIRLGSEIENGFRHYYMSKMNHPNNLSLNADPNIRHGIFQRLKGNNTLQSLYKAELSIELEAIPGFPKIKEFMVARHLYTHRAGLLDEKFIDDWKEITGLDLNNNQDIVNLDYPNNDTYWFKPLEDIWEYNRSSVSIFKALPK